MPSGGSVTLTPDGKVRLKTNVTVEGSIAIEPEGGGTPDSFQRTSEKGQPDGYAELDSSGKVPLSQLPAGIGSDADTLDGLDSTDFQTRDEKGVANGYASLDSSGVVPDSQLPPASARSRAFSMLLMGG